MALAEIRCDVRFDAEVIALSQPALYGPGDSAHYRSCVGRHQRPGFRSSVAVLLKTDACNNLTAKLDAEGRPSSGESNAVLRAVNDVAHARLMWLEGQPLQIFCQESCDAHQ